jgi:hypothetical protein
MNLEPSHDDADDLNLPAPSLSISWRWLILVNSIAVGIALLLSPVLYAVFVHNRDEARDNQASVNAFFCSENNRQDRALGRLLAAADTQGGFGAGVDRSRLTQFDRQVLSTIAKVQQVSPQNKSVRKAFRNEQVRLQKDTPCRRLALKVATATGSDPDSIEIIRIGPEIRH